MTGLKICGMRSVDDLEACRGADYLGFVVLSDSPRCLELDHARDLMSVCEGRRVAVTTERRPEVLKSMVRTLDPDVLQLHSPLDRTLLSEMAGIGVPLWGMLPVRPGTEVDMPSLPHLSALVLDSPGPRAGGNGRTHDWSLSRALRDMVAPLPVVLAGGLTAENVHRAIEVVQPSVIDVSSGAEANGRKDPCILMRIIEAIRGAQE
ncbi:MAG TPA: phosphoribosylanthranilate isomerase [Methanomassiliicoccales archaeon]|nr:phosphoribosylanthranilate isomerase [Methanomassiliicoccales archaeon]